MRIKTVKEWKGKQGKGGVRENKAVEYKRNKGFEGKNSKGMEEKARKGRN